MTTKAPMSATDLAATAFHEAAHAAAIVLRGGTVTDCRAYDTERNGAFGHTRYTGLSDADETFTTYIGPFLEARLRAGGEPSLTAINASMTRNCGDRSDLDDAGHYGLPRHHEPQYAALIPAVKALASTMLSRDDMRITHTDVQDALGIRRDGSNRALVASMVKAGMSPDAAVKVPGQPWNA